VSPPGWCHQGRSAPTPSDASASFSSIFFFIKVPRRPRRRRRSRFSRDQNCLSSIALIGSNGVMSFDQHVPPKSSSRCLPFHLADNYQFSQTVILMDVIFVIAVSCSKKTKTYLVYTIKKQEFYQEMEGCPKYSEVRRGNLIEYDFSLNKMSINFRTDVIAAFNCTTYSALHMLTKR